MLQCKIMMSSTILLRQYKSTVERCECNAGNWKLALDCGAYPSAQTDCESVVRKLGHSLIHMPYRLQHAMCTLLLCPPKPGFFSNLQVLNGISTLQTLSVFLRHCPQIRELHQISTQPEQCCAWADLQCCHTLEQLDQVVLHCMLGDPMSVPGVLAWQVFLTVWKFSDCCQAQDKQLAGHIGPDRFNKL